MLTDSVPVSMSFPAELDLVGIAPSDHTLPSPSDFLTQQQQKQYGLAPVSGIDGVVVENRGVNPIGAGLVLAPGDAEQQGVAQLCTFFLRTGTCAYGDLCKFKHPQDRPPPQLNSRGGLYTHHSSRLTLNHDTMQRHLSLTAEEWGDRYSNFLIGTGSWRPPPPRVPNLAVSPSVALCAVTKQRRINTASRREYMFGRFRAPTEDLGSLRSTASMRFEPRLKTGSLCSP